MCELYVIEKFVSWQPVIGCSHASTMLECGVSWPTQLARTWSIEIPDLTIGPFWMGTPDSRLPVCPGWMPIPTAGLLKRPLTTLIFFFSGSSGASDLLNSSSAPAPLAHQWFPLIPLPMNSTAKRLGNGGSARTAATGLLQAGKDSSHGSAMLTPTPRN